MMAIFRGRLPCTLGGYWLTVLLAGPLSAQSATTDSATIHQLGQQFSAAYVRGDPAAMAALYTPDAVIFPERSHAITGRKAIQRYWTLPSGRRITRHQVIPQRIEVEGKHAYDHGTYEISGEGDGKSWGPFRGKYVVVWRRQPEGWRMQLDMWNSGPETEP